MTVKQLISKLKKMPQNAKIFTADHDHGEYETNSAARKCELIDKNDMTEWINDKGEYEGDPTFLDTPKKYVVIRP